MLQNIVRALDSWRKRTFPPSKNDIEWRHTILDARLDGVNLRFDELSARLDAIARASDKAVPAKFVPSPATIEASVPELASIVEASGATLDQKTLAVLGALYSPDATVTLSNGDAVSIDRLTRISIEQGLLLHSLITRGDISRTLEIGFAYGYSTVWILDALHGKPGAKHISIDPFEVSGWKSVGLSQVEKLGLHGIFQWIEDYSLHALSDLIRQKQIFDLIYIDGNHRFDDVIVDFYLCDQVLTEGGLMVLDDMWMPSIRTAADFLSKNRFYTRITTPVANVAVFRKTSADDARSWDHFAPFEVAL